MKSVIALVALVASANAMADGFVCQTLDESLNVKVYNHVQPSEGTRNAAIMVVSDPNVQDGRKTIATFSDASGLLDNESTVYTSKVDLRFSNSDSKGELIGGTKLGQLKKIVLDVAFNYSYPMEAGDLTKGTIHLHKRNGDIISLDAECERYLKN